MALGPGLNGGDCTPRPRSDGQQLALAIFHDVVHHPHAAQKVVV